MKHFISAVDYIKNRLFEVEVPAFYHPHMPEEMVNPPEYKKPKINRFRMTAVNPRPPILSRPVFDPNQLQRAKYSIEVMLDMFNKQIEFSLVQTFDVVEILENLDRYLLSLKADVDARDPKITEYAKLVIRYRAEVYKHYYRYMKLNPTALATLYPNNDPTKNIFSLIGGLGTARDVANLDPLKAKAFPPYEIHDGSESEAEPSAEMLMETSLGISKVNALLSDDGKNFSIDDFLKRG